MVKEQFPILSKEVNNKPLIYLDNASTTQKPASVIDEIQEYNLKLWEEISFLENKRNCFLSHFN